MEQLSKANLTMLLEQHLHQIVVGTNTTRKHAKDPPQKYQYEDEPVPIYIYIPMDEP